MAFKLHDSVRVMVAGLSALETRVCKVHGGRLIVYLVLGDGRMMPLPVSAEDTAAEVLHELGRAFDGLDS